MKKMKTGLLISVFLTIVLVVMGCSSDQSSSSGESNKHNDDEKIVLRASSGLTTDAIWLSDFLIPWMERVEEESNGRVEFEFYSNAELVKYGGELDALKAGLIDVALPMMILYDPHRFPLSEVTMLPVANSNTEIANNAYHKLVNSDKKLKDGMTFFELEIESKGLKGWAVNTTYPSVINTSGKQFSSPQDFNNIRLRSSARLTEIFVKNLGATPISMPLNEVFDAISRGAIDGSVMAIGDWKQLALQSEFKYALVGANMGHFSSLMGMTEEKWNSLPKDIQEIMDNAAKEQQISGNSVQGMFDREAEVFEMVEGEVEFQQLDDLNPEMKDHINQAMVKTWFEWIEITEAAGYPGKEVAILWRDFILEEGGNLPDEIKEIE